MNDVSCPPILYHYTSIPAFKNIIRKKQFWLTHYKDVDDNNELLLGVNIVEEALTEKFSKPGILNEQFRNISRTTPQNSYIGCFCHRNDNDYLWENYARGGVVIGFETNYWLQQSTVKLMPVIYDQNSFRKLCADVVDKLNPIDAAHEEQLKGDNYNREMKKYKERLYAIPEYLNTRDGVVNLAAWGTLIKNPCYKPEEEWRLFHDPEVEQQLFYIESNGKRRAIFDFGQTQLPIKTLNFYDSDETVHQKGIYNFLIKHDFQPLLSTSQASQITI